MKRFIYLIFVFLVPSNSYSQSLSQSIRGTVVDKDSKTPVTGANVVLVNASPFKGTATDINGSFKLEDVPIGRHSLHITYVGYKEILISDIIVNSAKEVVITAEMEENFVQAKEVTVIAVQEKDKPLNEMSTVSTRTFTIDETNRFAGSWGDPSRMAANFAGVTSGNDQRNDIVVRGNSPLGVLWRLDGMEIPSPNHFSTSGSSGGAISILNNNTLENSDFMTSAFAAEYGNAISGVFDLRMRKGNNEKHEYLVQVGAAGFELGVEGPFAKGKKSSYMISYRYSAFGLLGKFGFFDFVGSIPYYQDITYKFFFPYKKGNVSIFGLGGKSNISFDAEKDTAKWKADPGLMRYRYNEAKMGAAGITWTHFLSSKTFLRLGEISSYSSSLYFEDSTDYGLNTHRMFTTDFGEGNHTVSLIVNSKISPRNTVKAGISGSNLFFNFQTDRHVYVPSDFLIRIIDFKGSSNLTQGFVEWKFRIRENISLNSGVHQMYYFLNNRSSTEPRAALKWDFTKKQSFSLGFGMHSKILPSGVYFGEVTNPDGSVSRPNKSLDYVHAAHYVFGYDNLLTNDLHLKLETYYQEITGAPVLRDTATYFSGLNSGADYENITSTKPLISKGTGRNYGVEITFEKFYSGGYYFLATGSLYDSKYKGSDGIERNTAFNSNYAYNLLGGKEFKVGREKNNVLAFNITWVTIGGRRVVPIDLAVSRLIGDASYDYQNAYSQKMQNYMRMDGRISYRQNRKKFSHEIALDVRNIINHKNIFSQYYDPYTGTIKNFYQIGFFPVVFYRIEF